MEKVIKFIYCLFSNSVFIGFFGVFIGAFLSYLFQKRLNKTQNIFIIKSKVLEELMEKTNELAIKINQNSYMDNNVSNELRTYIKFSKLEIDDKIDILKIVRAYSKYNFDITGSIDNIILYFKLNSIPLYRLSSFRKKMEELLDRYSKKYNEYFGKINELSDSLIEDKKISKDYVDSFNELEKSISSLKDEILYYLTDLNIIIQNELYIKIYKSQVKRIDNSKYTKLDVIENEPKVIDVNE